MRTFNGREKKTQRVEKKNFLLEKKKNLQRESQLAQLLILDAFAVNNERTIEESMTFEFDSKNETNTLTTKIRRIYFYLAVFSN